VGERAAHGRRLGGGGGQAGGDDRLRTLVQGPELARAGDSPAATRSCSSRPRAPARSARSASRVAA
jgi:hypothetical protein